MRVDQALERMGGIADRRSLLRVSTRSELESAVADGSIIQAGRSRYAVAAADEAHVAAARLRGVASHTSAALLHGWKVKTAPRAPHVTVARRRSRLHADGVIVHWGCVSEDELAARVTDPVRTVVDCARVLPFDEALAVADSALRSGKVRRAELTAAALASPRTGRAAAVRVVRAADRRAANPFESVLRAIALDIAGISVVAQGAVDAIGHADLTDPSLRIALEAESFEFHALPDAFRYDVRRYTAMTRLGWLVLRFVWEDVMERPAYVAEAIADVVALRARTQAVGGSGRPAHA